jgi:hypothetical protein
MTYLEPCTSLRSRLKCVGEAAVKIVTWRRGVGRTVCLPARLDPDESVLQWITSVCGRTHAEPRANYVAPVSPGELGSWLDTITACRAHR